MKKHKAFTVHKYTIRISSSLTCRALLIIVIIIFFFIIIIIVVVFVCGTTILIYNRRTAFKYHLGVSHHKIYSKRLRFTSENFGHIFYRFNLFGRGSQGRIGKYTAQVVGITPENKGPWTFGAPLYTRPDINKSKVSSYPFALHPEPFVPSRRYHISSAYFVLSPTSWLPGKRDHQGLVVTCFRSKLRDTNRDENIAKMSTGYSLIPPKTMFFLIKCSNYTTTMDTW